MILLAFLVVLAGCGTAWAMEPLEDQDLSRQVGEGLALGFEDMRWLAGPTTYLEATGTSSPAPPAPWKRGDARWYGFGFSGTTATAAYTGSCTAGYNNLGCPIGNLIPYYASFDNPFLLRAFDYTAIRHGGSTLTETVFELLGPTNQSPYRYSFWAELWAGGNTANRLQSQVVANNSRLSTVDVPGSSTRVNNKIRIIKHTDTSDPTIGFIWENHWTGDFRFSVNQTFASLDLFGIPPEFSSSEGFYSVGVKAFIPVGQVFYQSLIVDDVATDLGNFRFELTLVPNTATVYNNFYSLATGDTAGYERRDSAAGTWQKPSNAALDQNNYYRTHGYFIIGDWYPTPANYSQDYDSVTAGTQFTNHWQAATGAACPGVSTSTQSAGCNGARSTGDGTFFVAYDPVAVGARFTAYSQRPNVGSYDGDSNPNYALTTTLNPWNAATNNINLGDSRIYGLLVNHLELRTKGI